MSRVIVVDEQDREVGLTTYEKRQFPVIYRVTALFLTDISGGYCLITQRKVDANHNDPGKWMMAASGTVEEGETYDSNVATEAREELGITNLSFEKKDKIFIDDGTHRFFVQYYAASVNKDEVIITIEEAFVEQYKWIEIKDLIYWFNENPKEFVPSMKESLLAVGVNIENS